MEKVMKENFEMLERRVLDALSTSDMQKIRDSFKKIDGPTICVGVGGSSVVSEFASKVLSKKNKIIAVNKEPRDLLYDELVGYRNVLMCSYGGNNYGVDMAFDNDLNKYLLSSNRSDSSNVESVQYSSTLTKEKSFISLAATIIPMAILLNYYMDGNDNDIAECLKPSVFEVDQNNCYEIMTGIDTSSASTFLESTFVESGIAIPVVHDKYAFCHGRSTLSHHINNALVYFYRYKEFDELMLEEAVNYYNKIIQINGKYDDPIIDDFYLTIKALYLSKAIAEAKGQDLSGVDYAPIVKKLYRYKGQI